MSKSSKYDSTKDVIVPSDTLERVIGQDKAVRFAKIAAKQKRHLLLVGPPGTGKSMIARAMAYLLPKPKYEISVVNNVESPERPIVQFRTIDEVVNSDEIEKQVGKIMLPEDVPVFVSERLGFRCRRCGVLSSVEVPSCPKCGADKFKVKPTPFDDMIALQSYKKQDRVHALWKNKDKDQTVIFERHGDKIRMLSPNDLKIISALEVQKNRKVIVPFKRSTFIQATGASEAEVLGDVRHDPYGSHPEIGTPAYKRVIPGAIHEAHEGVLFIDEIATLGEIQRHILTAMQDKYFPITGHNPTSAGAAVRVDNVPCDFIFVAATNVQQLQDIIPPLRSRIRGNGYELLVNTHMPKTKESTEQMVQFIAQEIIKDGSIPHATSEAVDEILKVAELYAKRVDDFNGYTLRLRALSGLIKLSGDLAFMQETEFIERKHVIGAFEDAKSVEEQLTDKYGSLYKASFSDFGYINKEKPKVGTA